MKRLPLSGYEPTFKYSLWGDVGRTRDNCYDYAFGDDAKRNQKSVPGNHSVNRNKFANTNFRTCRGFTKRVLADNPRKVYKAKNPCKVCKKGYYKVMAFVAPTNIYGNSSGDFHWYRQNKAVMYKIRPGDTIYGLSKFFKVPQYVIKKALSKQKTPVSSNEGKIANKNVNFKQAGPVLKSGKVIKIPVNLWSHKQGWATGPLLVDASNKVITDPRKANRRYGYNYSRFCSAYCVLSGGKVVTGNPISNRN
jgi:hypothetical protein